MRVCTAKQMNEADRFAMDVLGIPGTELMFHAASGLLEKISARFDNLSKKKMVILAGNGNNAGDGFALATLAGEADMLVSIVRINTRDLSEDAAYYAAQIQDIPVCFFDQNDEECKRWIGEADVIVDAMYGTGFRGSLSGAASVCAEIANRCSALRVAADLPSGVCCDTGAVDGVAFRADLTVTFTAKKPCHFLYPAAEYCGRVEVCDIGIPERVLDDGRMWEITPALVKSVLPSRPSNSHKGTFGRLLTYCGSEDMTGAAVLCVGAALHTGVGLVEVAGPASVIAAVSAYHPEPIYTRLPETAEGDHALMVAAGRAKAIVCGCGLSQAVGQERRVTSLIRHASCPIVVDADGITALSRNIDIIASHDKELVLTPHPLEMARLTGKTVEEIQADRIGTACAFAQKHRITVVLKGANTVVAAPDGRVWLNAAACSALAKGGSGDVLSGVIGALLAQGVDAPWAAVIGVYIHAQAGLIGAEKMTEYCLLPSQLHEFFPDVFRQIKEG